MQLEVEELSPIKKRVNVTVPSNRVDSSFSSAYNNISRRVTLPGFRRGRIPMSHLRKRYGRQAAADVSQAFIEEGWRKAIDELSLKPVGEPEIDADLPRQGKEYGFSITIEVAPDFELQPYDQLSIEKDEWKVPDAVVDHEIEHIAEDVAPWEPVTDRTVAQKGDMAVLDYHGTVDGEAFAGGTAEGADIELGAEQLIPGFEEQIIGQEVGSEFTVTVTFPEDYPAEHLAGKTAEFACTLHDLKTRTTPEPGPELAALLGEEDMETVRQNVRERIEKRYENRGKSEAHTALREQIADAYDFEVPPSLVQATVADKRNEALSGAMRSGVDFEEAQKQFDEKADELEQEAAREVRAELVLDAIAEAEDISVPEADVHAYIDQAARSMGQYGVRLRQAYRDPNRRAGLRRRMRQDKVLDFLLTRANVTSNEREVPLHTHDDEDTEEGKAE